MQLKAQALHAIKMGNISAYHHKDKTVSLKVFLVDFLESFEQ